MNVGNQIGVCEWSLPLNGPFAVELAAAAGFEGISLGDLGGAEAGFPMNSRHIQEGYLQAASDCHVTLQSLHPYGLQRQGSMLFPMDTPQGREGMQSLLKCIDACADMGIPQLMVSSFFATLVRNDWEFEMFARMLKYAVELGRDKGVTVVYESVLTPQRILRMIETVGGDLKICYDILNPIRWGTGDPREEIRILDKYIDHFHVKDAPYDLKGYCPIGQGRADFAGTAGVIRDIGFEGWLVSENYYTLMSASSGIDFLDLAAGDIESIKKCLA